MQAQEPHESRPKGSLRSTARFLLLSSAIALLGLAACFFRFGNPYLALGSDQIIVKESLLPDALTPTWSVIEDGHAIILPGVQIAHTVNTTTRHIQASIVASTQSGLTVTIGPVDARYSIPTHGALDLIQTIGANAQDHERFTRAIIVVAARSAMAELKTLFVQSAASIEALSQRAQVQAGDALAKAGIILETLNLNQVRYQSDADGYIARLSAANARMQDAQARADKDNQTAAKKMATLTQAHSARLSALVDEYSPAVRKAALDADARLKRIESDFQLAQHKSEITRRVDAIKTESLEYSARQAARGLKHRIDEARNWPTELHQRALTDLLLRQRKSKSNPVGKRVSK